MRKMQSLATGFIASCAISGVIGVLCIASIPSEAGAIRLAVNVLNPFFSLIVDFRPTNSVVALAAFGPYIFYGLLIGCVSRKNSDRVVHFLLLLHFLIFILSLFLRN